VTVYWNPQCGTPFGDAAGQRDGGGDDQLILSGTDIAGDFDAVESRLTAPPQITNSAQV
jgi:hypothetical protein